MSLELHVWAPAFSLPSIDPQCLAAIIYLRHVVPRNEWELIASSDDSISPTESLPALRDGSTWVGGFQNIVDHLSSRSDRHWDLDLDNCSPKAQADITAFTSFIEAHGQPLLDLSLYVSSENYTSTTRPALSDLLKWPGQWTVSPRKRSMAKARTDHLGVSSLDLDTVTDTHNKPAVPTPSDVIPQSLRIPKPTVLGLAKQPQHAARFRLDALSDAFFEPLQELLGRKRYMMSEEKPSSLDCIAVAYLALALSPQVPQRWLAETMTARYPDLCTYARRLTKDAFGGPVKLEDALIGTEGKDGSVKDSHTEGWQNSKRLRWKKPAQRGLLDAGSALVSGMLSSLPLAEHVGSDRILLEQGRKNRLSGTVKSPTTAESLALPSLLALGSAFVAAGGYLLYSDTFNRPMPQSKNLSAMGDAGAMLGMGLLGGYNVRPGAERQHGDRIPVGLEMDVEVDGVAAH